MSGTVTFSNCLIGTGAVLPGGGNIRSNPEFSDWPALDCRLSSISPCVNAGVNQPWMNGGVDLDNKVRIDRFLGIVDIGCYESTPRGMLVRIR